MSNNSAAVAKKDVSLTIVSSENEPSVKEVLEKCSVKADKILEKISVKKTRKLS